MWWDHIVLVPFIQKLIIIRYKKKGPWDDSSDPNHSRWGHIFRGRYDTPWHVMLRMGKSGTYDTPIPETPVNEQFANWQITMFKNGKSSN